MLRDDDDHDAERSGQRHSSQFKVTTLLDLVKLHMHLLAQAIPRSGPYVETARPSWMSENFLGDEVDCGASEGADFASDIAAFFPAHKLSTYDGKEFDSS